MKDIYNQLACERKEWFSNISGTLKFLNNLAKKDSLMVVRHTIDSEWRLQNLFWYDGQI